MSNTVVFKCVVDSYDAESKVVTTKLSKFEQEYKVVSYIPLEKKEYTLVCEMSKDTLMVRAIVDEDPVVILAGTVTSTKNIPYEDKQLTSVNLVANTYNIAAKENQGIFYSFLTGKLPVKKGDNLKAIGYLFQRVGEGKEKQKLIFNNIKGVNYGYLGIGKKSTEQPEEESTTADTPPVDW